MSIATVTPGDRISSVRRLSPMQAGMLAETLLAPSPGVNIVQFVIQYEERVDAEALRRAWQLAVDSFPIFRTQFAWREGSPSQSVQPRAEIPWAEVPEEALAAEERAAEREATQTEPGTTADVHYDFTQFGLDRSQATISRNLRTSLVVGFDSPTR